MAYANWAAPSVVSATILAAAFLVHHKARGLIGFSIALGVVAQAMMLVGDVAAYRVALPLLPPGKSDIYNRSLGFRSLADQAGALPTGWGRTRLSAKSAGLSRRCFTICAVHLGKSSRGHPPMYLCST